jgi:hypothetical protein
VPEVRWKLIESRADEGRLRGYLHLLRIPAELHEEDSAAMKSTENTTGGK